MTATASTTATAFISFSEYSPAFPTDTNAVLVRLLALCEESRRISMEAESRPVIPRPILAMLLRAIKLRDPALLSHSQRIAAISSGVAQLLGWDSEQRLMLEIAALLHDLARSEFRNTSSGSPENSAVKNTISSFCTITPLCVCCRRCRPIQRSRAC